MEVSQAAGDPEGARQASAELADIAGTFGTVGLGAAADHAAGLIAVSENRTEEAVASLERSWRAWRQIGVSTTRPEPACVLARPGPPLATTPALRSTSKRPGSRSSAWARAQVPTKRPGLAAMPTGRRADA